MYDWLIGKKELLDSRFIIFLAVTLLRSFICVLSANNTSQCALFDGFKLTDLKSTIVFFS